MSITIHPAHGTGAHESGGREHAGYRYLRWIYYLEPKLTADQKAEGNEAFAAEFESLPASQEPYEGWGDTMAYLCRRIARRHRREPVGEWMPSLRISEGDQGDTELSQPTRSRSPAVA